ncbi:MAG: ATP-dependent Clp protease ATP-binding subunit [Saprospirales bacterium]|nr:ATP-dependent Clp protease ATP-binding subunit [Saprospirales bacterium]
MPNIRLNIPVLVQQQEDQAFAIRPLFLPSPVVYHHRFEKALSLFRVRVRQIFRGYSLGRENMEVLFWYNFSPPYEFKRLSLKFDIKSRTVNGSFSVVHFELDGKVFLSFPGFDNFMAMIHRPERGKDRIKTEAEEIIHKLLIQAYQSDPDHFHPENYLAVKREFVTHVGQDLNFLEEGFKFEKTSGRSPFQFFRKSPDFNGESELQKVGHSLNELFPGQLRRAFFREELVQELYQSIFDGANTPIALVGPEGVGRHSVLEEALYRYLRNRGRKRGREEKIWYLDPTRVISGMSIVGMWEKRLEAILNFLKTTGLGVQNDKLLVDNPVALPRIGKSASNNLVMSHVLKPYLERREIQMLVIATPEEWKLVQEKDRSFTDLFQVIRIAQPSIDQAFQMAMEQRKRLESAHSCQFSIQAIMHLFSTYRNFFRNKALPGAITKWMGQLAVKYQGGLIDFPQVLAEFRGISGFEEQVLDDSLVFEEDEVYTSISRLLVGQEAAVKALSDSIHLIKARLNDPSKPLASYLFIGPTGVGKTQGAKVLAEFLTGHSKQLIRFDMNEYIDPYATIRLVGDYQQPEGLLISKVRYQPFGILLLDEIEKAHPSVHDLLLQVLDDGRLTDGRGRTVDFSNTIIIMTSNLGAREVSSRMGFRQEASDEAGIYEKEVQKFFRPEFINRIDRIVVFNPLRLEHILDIARLQIAELLQRDGFLRRATMVNIDPKALEWVAQRGFDSKMGGRALKRQIERDLTTLTAEQLIESKADAPILFDIYLEGGKLVPRITTLEFAASLPEGWLPRLPAGQQNRGFYEKLLFQAERLDKDIQRLTLEPGTEEEETIIFTGRDEEKKLDWVLFQAKDQARALTERLKMILLGYREYRFRHGPLFAFRLKPSAWRSGGSDTERHKIEDQFFKKQALHDIYLRYQYGDSSFDSAHTEMLNDYLDVIFLELTRLAIQKKRLDQGYFKVESYLSGKGKEQVAQLLTWYAELMEFMGIPGKLDLDQQKLEVEGYGVAELFKAEQGIHLFFLSQETPLPIMTFWVTKGKEHSRKKEQHTILRLYDENKTITDLRSGFTNTFHITTEELKLLVFAGLPEALRKKLIPN